MVRARQSGRTPARISIHHDAVLSSGLRGGDFGHAGADASFTLSSTLESYTDEQPDSLPTYPFRL